MTIKTERLEIREMVFSDYIDYYNYAKCEEVARLAGFKPIDNLETAKHLVLGAIYSGDTYSIFLKPNQIFIGTCNIYKRSIRQLKDVYTLGISLAKEYQGLGYGSECIKALVKYTFKHKHAEVIEMMALKENIRSQKMILKNGFKEDGLIKKYNKLYDGTIYDVILYSYFKEDYEEDIKWKKY